MATKRSISVLVSDGKHPGSGTSRACKGDIVALACAQALQREPVRVVHAGNAKSPALPDYLGYGAGQISVVPVAQETNVLEPLAEAFRTSDLVFTGTRTEVGEGSGLLPYLLAKALGRPIIVNVLKVTPVGDALEILQFLPKGKRRLLRATGQLVLAIHPLAPVELRYAYAKRVSGKIETVATSSATPSKYESAWQLESAPRHAQILSAPETRSAHQRMLDAVSPKTKSGLVVAQGSATDKAQVLINYLRDNKLIEL